jgi:hypothetical protein
MVIIIMNMAIVMCSNNENSIVMKNSIINNNENSK